MSISSLTNRVTYNGDGSSTVFPFAYEFFTQTDLAVYIYNSSLGQAFTQVLNTNYTVSGTQNSQGVYPSGGNVVFNSSVQTGNTIVITRGPSLVQNWLLNQNGTINSVALTNQLDYMTLISQRLQDEISRALKLSDGFAGVFDTNLPCGMGQNPRAGLFINASSTGFSLAFTSSSVILPISIAQGGTGQVTAPLAFDALAPTTLVGDLISRGAGGNQAVAGNATSTKKFLTETGSGGFAVLPVWNTIATTDLPTIPLSQGGTGVTASTALQVFNVLSPMAALGDSLYGGAAGAATVLSGNTTATLKALMQTGSGAVSAAPVWTQLVPPSLTTVILKGDGVFTPQATTKAFKVTLCGGGGGGGSVASAVNASGAAGGGGGGGSAIKMFLVGSSVTGAYTVGTGGPGGVAGGGNTGTTGSSTVFTWGAVTVTGNPGVGGTGAASLAVGSSATVVINGGTGGAASSGDLNITGGKGRWALTTISINNGVQYVTGGDGGATFMSVPGSGTINSEAAGGAGALGGGGGGAAQRGNGSSFAGGNGGVGYIIFEEYMQ